MSNVRAYQQTSLQSYSQEQKVLGERQLQVLTTLKSFPNHEATNTMISVRSGLPINVVTPRIYELRQKRRVKESYTDTCPITNRKAIFWRAI